MFTVIAYDGDNPQDDTEDDERVRENRNIVLGRD